MEFDGLQVRGIKEKPDQLPRENRTLRTLPEQRTFAKAPLGPLYHSL